MRKKTALFLGLAACMGGLLSLTACDPDDVDDFAAGYRYGYESQQGYDDDDDYKKSSTQVEPVNEVITIE